MQGFCLVVIVLSRLQIYSIFDFFILDIINVCICWFVVVWIWFDQWVSRRSVSMLYKVFKFSSNFIFGWYDCSDFRSLIDCHYYTMFDVYAFMNRRLQRYKILFLKNWGFVFLLVWKFEKVLDIFNNELFYLWESNFKIFTDCLFTLFCFNTSPVRFFLYF